MESTFREPKTLTSVAAFHELFGAYTQATPGLPPAEVGQLRINLLQEELDELKQAIAEKDLVAVADALADLQYVLSGAVLAFGLQDIFADLFDEVQRSNMSKACKTREEAETTAIYYKNERQTDNYITEKDGKYIVQRVGDHKVLKSVAYSPANLGEKLHTFLATGH